MSNCNNCAGKIRCLHKSQFYPQELWDIIGGKHIVQIDRTKTNPLRGYIEHSSFNETPVYEVDISGIYVDQIVDNYVVKDKCYIAENLYDTNLPIEPGFILVDDLLYKECPQLWFSCTTEPFEPYVVVHGNNFTDIIPYNYMKMTDFDHVVPYGTEVGNSYSSFNGAFGLPNKGFIREFGIDMKTFVGKYLLNYISDMSSYFIYKYISRCASHYPNALMDTINIIDCNSFINLGDNETALSFTRILPFPIFTITNNSLYHGFILNDILVISIDGVDMTQFTSPISGYGLEKAETSLLRVIYQYYYATGNVPNSVEVKIYPPMEGLGYDTSGDTNIILRNLITDEIIYVPYTNINGVTVPAYAPDNRYYELMTYQLGTHYEFYANATSEIIWINNRKYGNVPYANDNTIDLNRSNDIRHIRYKNIVNDCGYVNSMFEQGGSIGITMYDIYQWKEINYGLQNASTPLNPNSAPTGFPPEINFQNGTSGTRIYFDDNQNKYIGDNIVVSPCSKVGEVNLVKIEIYNPDLDKTFTFVDRRDYNGLYAPFVENHYNSDSPLTPDISIRGTIVSGKYLDMYLYTGYEEDFFSYYPLYSSVYDRRSTLSSYSYAAPLLNLIDNPVNISDSAIYFIFPSGSHAGLHEYKLEYSGQNLLDLPIYYVITEGAKSGTSIPILYSEMYKNDATVRRNIVQQIDTYPQYSGLLSYYDEMNFNSFSGYEIPIFLIVDKMTQLQSDYLLNNFSGTFTYGNSNPVRYKNYYTTGDGYYQYYYNENISYPILSSISLLDTFDSIMRSGTVGFINQCAQFQPFIESDDRRVNSYVLNVQSYAGDENGKSVANL